jgi:hypothetical protein
MVTRYMRFNQYYKRIHQEKIDFIESGRDNKNTKATKRNPHNKHVIYEVVDPISATKRHSKMRSHFYVRIST